MPAEGIWVFIQWAHYMALALWLGGIFLLFVVVAPAVHGSMASRAVAGQIVGRALRRLNSIELFCCFLLVATLLSSREFVRDGGIYYLLTGVLIMGAITSFYSFFVASRLELLRERTPGFDTLDAEHLVRRAFRVLHRSYVGLMSLNFILGSVILYYSVMIFE